MAARARRRRVFLPYRILRSRPRLFFAAAVGTVVATALSLLTGWRTVTGVLVGWDVGAALYLGLAFSGMARAQVRDIRRHAAEQDEGRAVILALTVAAGLASLIAIVAELSQAGGGRQPAQLGLAGVTILLSWAVIHTIFALHYTHEFYGENAGRAGGMTFPGGHEQPGYWDFVYFSFVIGMTSQVSDVAVTSTRVRRTVTAHSIVSFIFNVALLALTINIAAGAL